MELTRNPTYLAKTTVGDDYTGIDTIYVHDIDHKFVDAVIDQFCKIYDLDPHTPILSAQELKYRAMTRKEVIKRTVLWLVNYDEDYEYCLLAALWFAEYANYGSSDDNPFEYADRKAEHFMKSHTDPVKRAYAFAAGVYALTHGNPFKKMNEYRKFYSCGAKTIGEYGLASFESVIDESEINCFANWSYSCGRDTIVYNKPKVDWFRGLNCPEINHVLDRKAREEAEMNRIKELAASPNDSSEMYKRMLQIIPNVNIRYYTRILDAFLKWCELGGEVFGVPRRDVFLSMMLEAAPNGDKETELYKSVGGAAGWIRDGLEELKDYIGFRPKFKKFRRRMRKDEYEDPDEYDEHYIMWTADLCDHWQELMFLSSMWYIHRPNEGFAVEKCKEFDKSYIPLAEMFKSINSSRWTDLNETPAPDWSKFLYYVVVELKK